MAEDARIRCTRLALDRALVALLQEKRLDAITVRELCDRAGVSRATFYRHYEDVAALLNAVEEQILAELAAGLQGGTRDLASIITQSLRGLKSGGERYQALFSENGDPAFIERVFAVARKSVDGELAASFPQLSALERRWLFQYFSKGCSGIWMDWLEHGMTEPVEAVAQFTLRLIESSLG